MKLTAESIGALTLPAGKTDAIFFDEDLRGFGLRVRASGRRIWVAQYRIDGCTRRVTIGNAAIINEEQARLWARKLLGAVALRDELESIRARVDGILLPLIVGGIEELRRDVRAMLDDPSAEARAGTSTTEAAS
jgi:hypothetical protein